MATENWNENNLQQIPGFYNRFKIKAKERVNSKKNGVLAMPIRGDWGPIKKVISIKSEKDLKDLFGDNKAFSAYRLGKLALLGNPKEVLLYRLTDGNEKCGQIVLTSNEESPKDLIEIKTKYPSDRNFSITIRDNLVEEGTKDLILYESTRQLFKIEALDADIDELVARINSNIANEYIVAKKLDGASGGTLKNVVNTKLNGGNNGTQSITMEHYLNAMNEFECYKINGFVLDGQYEPGLHKCAEEWLKRTKENGLDILLALGGNPTEKIDQANNRSIELNNENIINVFSTAYYEGEKYTSAEIAVYIAALAVGQNIIDCLCNQKTVFDEVERLSKIEIESALNSGTLVLAKDDDEVVIVDDVNTLNNKSILRYIRTVKFINTVNEDTRIKKKDYIGKVPNKSTGQTIIICGLKQYFEVLNLAGIIDDFTVDIDQELQASASSDEFFWTWDARYINVIKKIYGSGFLRE